MDNDKYIGGCCGEIVTEIEGNVCNPLVMAQLMEYKLSHFIDKSFESLLGF